MTKVNEERVQEIFNSISSDYDKMNAIISFKQHDLWRAKTMKRMGDLTGLSILDLCCGTGDWTFDLSESVGPSGKVIGLDFSENMLEIAKAKLKEEAKKNIEFLQGNAMALPFEKGSFDVVTIGYGLRNTPDYLTVLKEIFRERRRELMGEGHHWFDRIREARIVGDDTEMVKLINEGGIYWPVAEEVMRENPSITQNEYWK